MKLVATYARRTSPALLHLALAQLSFFAAGIILFASALAFAQDGAPAAAEVDPLALVKLTIDGVQNGNGWLAAGPALTLVVFLVRKYDKLIPIVGLKIDAFLNQPLVAFALPVALSALTGLCSALAAHQPIVPALLAALKVAGAAVLTFLMAKNAAEQVKAAQAKGEVAAKDPGPTLGA
jgi:hypothetical protein